jgi:hypothetical protein
MPDWEKLVQDQLAGISLRCPEKVEVIAELAGHLEESFESFRQEGFSEQDATRRALLQVADWNVLRRKICVARNKEEIMEPRVRQFWVPGLLGFAFFFAFSIIMESASFRWYLGGKLWLLASHPLVLNLGRGTPILRFHIESLVLLIFVGAMAAGLSKRAGGSVRTSLLSCVFPAVPFAVVFLIAIPAGLIVSQAIPYGLLAREILLMALGWVLGPAVALLIGGLIMQRFLSGGSRPARRVNAGLA